MLRANSFNYISLETVLSDAGVISQITIDDDIREFSVRKQSLIQDPSKQVEFKREMQRFLPTSIAKQNVEKDQYWQFIIYLIDDLNKQLSIKSY